LENTTACLLAQEIGLALAATQSEGLRDKFAMAALTGCLAYSHVNPMTGNFHENSNPESVALACYEYADAMLTARTAKAEGR
jgi:hypothetical protein